MHMSIYHTEEDQTLQLLAHFKILETQLFYNISQTTGWNSHYTVLCELKKIILAIDINTIELKLDRNYAKFIILGHLTYWIYKENSSVIIPSKHVFKHVFHQIGCNQS